jgi:hypothetical protein
MIAIPARFVLVVKLLTCQLRPIYIVLSWFAILLQSIVLPLKTKRVKPVI